MTSARWPSLISPPDLETTVRRGGPEMLARAVAAGVVPRLVLAFEAPGARPPHPGCADAVDALLAYVIDGAETEAEALLAHVADMGASGECLMLDLLAPVARRLGDLWVSDDLDVVQVTLGVGRLRQLMHGIEHGFGAPPRQGAPRLLLGLAPGEHHGFGLSMIAAFFRRAGWDVVTVTDGLEASLLARVAARRFDVVGLSIAGERHIAALSACIRALRHASANPSIGVMVGGAALLRSPELTISLGADATATDARSAPARAERLLALLRAGGPGLGAAEPALDEHAAGVPLVEELARHA